MHTRFKFRSHQLFLDNQYLWEVTQLNNVSCTAFLYQAICLATGQGELIKMERHLPNGEHNVLGGTEAVCCGYCPVTSPSLHTHTHRACQLWLHFLLETCGHKCVWQP